MDYFNALSSGKLRIASHLTRAVLCLGLNSFLAPLAEGGTPEKLWEVEIGNSYGSAPAIGHNGDIYIGGYPHRFYSVSSDGEINWTFTTEGRWSGTPSIGDDNTIYVTSGRALYALDPGGSLLWEFNERGPAASNTLAIGSDGVIHVGFANDLIALNPDGKEKWRYHAIGAVDHPVIDSLGRLYFGESRSTDSGFTSVTQEGEFRWRQFVGDERRITPAVGGDGSIYVVGSIFPNEIFAFGTDGARKWQTPIGDQWSQGAAGVAIDAVGSLHVYNGNDDALLRFESDGSLRQSTVVRDDCGSVQAVPVVDASGSVFYSQCRSLLQADGLGKVLWSFDTGVDSDPALTDRGELVFCGGGTLFKFATDVPAARSSWPMAQGNVRRTSRVPSRMENEIGIHAVKRCFSEGRTDTNDSEAVFQLTRSGDMTKALLVRYSLGGTAISGIDYVTPPGELMIPAGASGAELILTALNDSLPETAEVVSVFLTHVECADVATDLQSCFSIGDRDQAHVILSDSGSIGLRDASVESLNLSVGQVFFEGTEIEFGFEVIDGGGCIDRLEVFASNGIETIRVGDAVFLSDSHLPDRPSEPARFRFCWKDVPAGLWSVVGVASDAHGESVQSGEEHVYVVWSEVPPFVTRSVSGGFLPGQPIVVSLVAVPVDSTDVYSVSETVPLDGWLIEVDGSIGNHQGADGRVVFGPFFDDSSRTLSYSMTPVLPSLSDTWSFFGESSIDGNVAAIKGVDAAYLAPAVPADLDPFDTYISSAEITGYVTAWRSGEPWPIGPSPIPIDYATRAAALWEHGGNYTINEAYWIPPKWWVPVDGRLEEDNLRRLPRRPTARRWVFHPLDPGKPLVVEIESTPASFSRTFAVEEKLSEGNQPLWVESGGVFDEKTGTIRWGMYYRPESRVVRYACSGRCSIEEGAGSFDGESVQIEMSQAQEGLAVVDRTVDGGGLECRVSVTVGRSYAIETTTDLASWTRVLEFVATEPFYYHSLEDKVPWSTVFLRLRPTTF